LVGCRGGNAVGRTVSVWVWLIVCGRCEFPVRIRPNTFLSANKKCLSWHQASNAPIYDLAMTTHFTKQDSLNLVANGNRNEVV
jgi:hypothetical protein